jgi:hypothetical protein
MGMPEVPASDRSVKNMERCSNNSEVLNMLIPENIKIGEHYYCIKKCKLIDWTNRNVTGKINYSDKKMKIRISEKDNRITEETFFHEIAHGILKELEYNHPGITKFRNDEMFVQELGLNLRRTLVDLLNNQDTGSAEGRDPYKL